jgi:amino acid permease
MDETESLRAELEHYKTEREKIRSIVGQIGGKTSRRVNTIINAVFLFLVLCAFGFDVLRHMMGWQIP